MMASAIESKQSDFDIDFISEYEREDDVSKPQTKSYAKDLLGSASEVISVARAIKSAVLPIQTGISQSPSIDNSIENVKSANPDVLETLWPGVHQDFSHSVTV